MLSNINSSPRFFGGGFSQMGQQAQQDMQFAAQQAQHRLEDRLHGRDGLWNQGFGWARPPIQTQGVELNGFRGHQWGSDGVLVFDFNGDGRYSRRDVDHTGKLMKAASGNFDLNGDGFVTFAEGRQAHYYKNLYNRLDRNRDGQLSRLEATVAGGKLWVDHDRRGNLNSNELYSPFIARNDNLGGSGWRPRQNVDPHFGRPLFPPMPPHRPVYPGP